MYSHSCGHFESKGQDDEKLWHFGVSSFRPIFWSSKANSQSRRQPRTFSSHLARCVSPPTNWAQFYGHVAREQDGDRSAGVFSLRFARPNHVFFRFWKIFWKHMEVKSPCWPFFWEDREMFPVTGVCLVSVWFHGGFPSVNFQTDLAPQMCSLGSNCADYRFQVISVISVIYAYMRLS